MAATIIVWTKIAKVVVTYNTTTATTTSLPQWQTVSCVGDTAMIYKKGIIGNHQDLIHANLYHGLQISLSTCSQSGKAIRPVHTVDVKQHRYQSLGKGIGSLCYREVALFCAGFNQFQNLCLSVAELLSQFWWILVLLPLKQRNDFTEGSWNVKKYIQPLAS